MHIANVLQCCYCCFLLSICCFGGVYLLFWGCLFVSLFVKHLILADLRFVFGYYFLHLLYYRHVVVGV